MYVWKTVYNLKTQIACTSFKDGGHNVRIIYRLYIISCVCVYATLPRFPNYRVRWGEYHRERGDNMVFRKV